MKILCGIGALIVCAGCALGDFVDDFEGYSAGGLPGGGWLDATSFIDEPTHVGPSVSVIETVDAHGNSTNAVQINDHVGTSGGMMSRVGHSSNQRFEIDVRLDQRGDGSSPNWMSAVGFFQDTDQTDFNWGPQAVVYASGNGRFRLFVQNNDGQGSGSRDFGLGNAQCTLGSWVRVSLEADTENGVFGVRITDLASGDLLTDVNRTYSGWNPEFGQYDLVSVNDGEYGSNPGSIGNMSSYDNARYVPSPGGLGLLAMGGMMFARRSRRD